MSESRRAVFLDRDGTVIRDAGYLSDESVVELLPGVAETLAKVKAAGLDLIVVTNQSGVARGYFPIEAVHRINAKVAEMLESASAGVTAVYFCPHYEKGVVQEYSHVCDCRKPAPGLLFRARDEINIDLARSFLVGDSTTDIECGMNAGVRTVLIREPKFNEGEWAGRSDEEVGKAAGADFVVDSISDIVGVILSNQ